MLCIRIPVAFSFQVNTLGLEKAAGNLSGIRGDVGGSRSSRSWSSGNGDLSLGHFKDRPLRPYASQSTIKDNQARLARVGIGFGAGTGCSSLE